MTGNQSERSNASYWSSDEKMYPPTAEVVTCERLDNTDCAIIVSSSNRFADHVSSIGLESHSNCYHGEWVTS